MSQFTEHVGMYNQNGVLTPQRVQIQSLEKIYPQKLAFQIKKNPIVQRRAFNQNRMILEGSFLSRNIQIEILD